VCWIQRLEAFEKLEEKFLILTELSAILRTCRYKEKPDCRTLRGIGFNKITRHIRFLKNYVFIMIRHNSSVEQYVICELALGNYVIQIS